MIRGKFQIQRTSSGTVQIDPASSLSISKSAYQPNGSIVVLGNGAYATQQELGITSRMFMTFRQREAETDSVKYAEELELDTQEVYVEPKATSDLGVKKRTAPYQAFFINGLGQSFSPKYDPDAIRSDVIYLELDLWKTLDIRSATIVCGPVGRYGGQPGKIPGIESEREDFQSGEKELLGWPSYPSPYLFNYEMDDVTGELKDSITGAPVTPGEERYQKKAYVLIGYMSADILVSAESLPIYQKDNLEYPIIGIISCVDSNLMVSHGLSGETPVLNISPYFGAGQGKSTYFEATEPDSSDDNS